MRIELYGNGYQPDKVVPPTQPSPPKDLYGNQNEFVSPIEVKLDKIIELLEKLTKG